MTLNGNEVDDLKYEEFLTKNVLVRNITIVKGVEKTSDYCMIC
jgi:hypothetical protein